jgi:hypothetical protein
VRTITPDRKMQVKTVLTAGTPAIAVILPGGMAVAQHHPGQAHHGHQSHGDAVADKRLLVEFPPDLTRRTLAKMRDHLFALQEITEALARGQNDQAARVAEERLGMSAMRLHGAHEVAKYMPQGIKDGGTREYVRICITSKPSNAPFESMSQIYLGDRNGKRAASTTSIISASAGS